VKERALTIAGLMVGWVKEATGQNDGPWVEAIQRVTGNKRGDPWCASFITFCLDLAYAGKNPLKRSASCDLLLEYARVKGWLTNDLAKVQPGDLFLVMKTPTDAVHVGFVTSVGKASVKTLEGNTNTAGSRDGWGVFPRERNAKSLQFICLP
jgi:hypothetical protein